MALDNLEQRLRARYGDAAIFSISRKPQQFTVSFTIPIDTDIQPGGAT
jgi:LytS/YehU family sensor histidine kinase